MLIYRITLDRFSNALHASGNPARWNSKDVKVIYTASSRALACLENIVHRNSIGPNDLFKTMVIEVPDSLKVTSIDQNDLPANWHEFSHYPDTQAIGDEWIIKGTTAVLRVPSAIVPEEFNYLLNPAHADFKKVKLLRTEAFEFDARIRGKRK